MSTSTLPVEGWVDTCASYGVAIMRALVTEIRDHGPLTPEQAKAIIRREGIGADVAKASPIFDTHDGADRILNLFLTDVDVVRRQPDGDLFIFPEVTKAHSKAKKLTITVESAPMLEAARDVAYRRIHLRRWIESKPFQTAWRNGIVKHTDEEIVAMADTIRDLGYHHGFPIVQDQFGMVIDGRLRLAALAKLGINPKPYTQTRVFANDVERLAWYLAAHCHNGKWPTAVRDSVVKLINGAAKRSGVKMEWPQDIAVAVGQFDNLPGVVESEPVSEAVSKSPAPSSRPHWSERQYTDKLPLVGSQIALVFLRLLETGRPMTTHSLGMKSSSVTYRAVQKGWLTLDGGVVSLTEQGTVIAKHLWDRDRKGRDVPNYGTQSVSAAHQPVTGIAALA
jgi:hypothetical protein